MAVSLLSLGETYHFGNIDWNKKGIIIDKIPEINEENNWSIADQPFLDKEYSLFGQPQPWLPPDIIKLLQIGKKRKLSNKQMTYLFNKIAKISIEFYKIQSGKFVAFYFNGRIVEIAENSIDLLAKIEKQGYKKQIFVWKVGSDVYSGWLP
jgi:hypothetical protein